MTTISLGSTARPAETSTSLTMTSAKFLRFFNPTPLSLSHPSYFSAQMSAFALPLQLLRTFCKRRPLCLRSRVSLLIFHSRHAPNQFEDDPRYFTEVIWRKPLRERDETCAPNLQGGICSCLFYHIKNLVKKEGRALRSGQLVAIKMYR